MIYTWLGISSNLGQLQLTADCVATVTGDPALYAFGAIITETHAAAIDGVDLGVSVEVSDTCGERSWAYKTRPTNQSKKN